MAALGISALANPFGTLRQIATDVVTSACRFTGQRVTSAFTTTIPAEKPLTKDEILAEVEGIKAKLLPKRNRTQENFDEFNRVVDKHFSNPARVKSKQVVLHLRAKKDDSFAGGITIFSDIAKQHFDQFVSMQVGSIDEINDAIKKASNKSSLLQYFRRKEVVALIIHAHGNNQVVELGRNKRDGSIDESNYKKLQEGFTLLSQKAKIIVLACETAFAEMSKTLPISHKISQVTQPDQEVYAADECVSSFTMSDDMTPKYFSRGIHNKRFVLTKIFKNQGKKVDLGDYFEDPYTKELNAILAEKRIEDAIKKFDDFFDKDGIAYDQGGFDAFILACADIYHIYKNKVVKDRIEYLILRAINKTHYQISGVDTTKPLSKYYDSFMKSLINSGKLADAYNQQEYNPPSNLV